MNKKHIKAILCDWGDTVMKDLPQYPDPMMDWPEVCEVEGVRDALKILSSQTNCYLATSAQDSTENQIWTALKRVDLDRFFKGIFCSENVGYPKGNRNFFETILLRLKLLPEQVIMVGDSFENDIKGANNCGIYGYWYNPKGFKTIKDKMYQSMHQLIKKF